MTAADAVPGADDRGQTIQDFAVGVSVFVLVVAFALAYLPTTIVPFDDGAAEPSAAVAEGLATNVLADLSAGGAPNTLDPNRTAALFRSADGDDVRADYGLRTVTSANVTLEWLDGQRVSVLSIGGPNRTVTPAAGDPAPTNSAETATRIVRLGPDRYRLVVRVW
jgi:hypothetical protein